jgi:hypothetical protein
MTHVEERASSTKGLALVGDCCRLPFGYIRDGKLVFRMPHVKGGHELELTPNDLRSLALLLEQASGFGLGK